MSKIQTKVIVYFWLLLSLFVILLNVPVYKSFADVVEYSDVLADLQKDENFNIEDYPLIEDDYSLQVIQIAESVEGKLFVYVYQPSAELKDYRATTVRISFTNEKLVSSEDVHLQFLNSNGVFYKYMLVGFRVSDVDVRYYNIVAIHRKFDKDVDNSSGNDNLIEEVVFDVSKMWIACTIDGEVYYRCEETKVIKVTGKWCGHIRYVTDWFYVEKDSDRWFVAFSTDLKIEDLYEADVSYSYRTYTNSSLGEMTEDELGNSRDYDQVEPIPAKVTVKGEDVVSSAGVLFKKKYKWNRIESVEEFVKENPKFKTNSNIDGMDWVLSFVETPYTVIGNSSLTSRVKGTEIGEVSLLRLEFITEGVHYNLGVVDNKQSADRKPDDIKGGLSFWEILLKLLPFSIVVIYVLLWLFVPRFMLMLHKEIGKAIWWIFTAPFSLFF